MPENTLPNDHHPAERGFDGMAWQEKANVLQQCKTIPINFFFLMAILVFSFLCFVFFFFACSINKILNKVVLYVWLNSMFPFLKLMTDVYVSSNRSYCSCNSAHEIL